MAEQRYEQPFLPLEFRSPQLVSWMVMKPVFQKRFGFFGGERIVFQQVIDSCSGEQLSRAIPADDIDKLKDKNLRYALRFQAATASFTPGAEGCHIDHQVLVTATDAGVESQLVSANYIDYARQPAGQPEGDAFLAYLVQLGQLGESALNESVDLCGVSQKG